MLFQQCQQHKIQTLPGSGPAGAESVLTDVPTNQAESHQKFLNNRIGVFLELCNLLNFRDVQKQSKITGNKRDAASHGTLPLTVSVANLGRERPFRRVGATRTLCGRSPRGSPIAALVRNWK